VGCVRVKLRSHMPIIVSSLVIGYHSAVVCAFTNHLVAAGTCSPHTIGGNACTNITSSTCVVICYCNSLYSTNTMAFNCLPLNICLVGGGACQVPEYDPQHTIRCDCYTCNMCVVINPTKQGTITLYIQIVMAGITIQPVPVTWFMICNVWVGACACTS
jgi:hypothetical protein